MNKIKILGIFALLGFSLGIGANVLYFEVMPILTQIFPQIFGITWMLWGIIGATIAVIGCLLYAFFPER
jgi:hypothetical protein